MKIRQRDGTMREVDDAYVLKDGEGFVIPLSFMDAARMIHDGNGHPAGQRPGFLVCDNEVAEAVRETVYRMYDDDIGRRWQSGRWQDQPSGPAPSAPVRTFDSAEAARAAVRDAYAQYDRDLATRWQRR